MRAIGRKMAHDKAESLRARVKVTGFAYASKSSDINAKKPTTKKVEKVVIAHTDSIDFFENVEY